MTSSRGFSVKKAFFSLLTLALLAAAAELVLRLCGLAPTGVLTMRYTTDGDGGFYDPAPNQTLVYNVIEALPHQVTINGQGLRREDDVDPDGAGVFRIVCLGDSYTFGTGVNDWETYPVQLDAILNASWGGRAWEVINGGVVGTTISDQLPHYRVRFASIRHDAVCFLACKGDIREFLYKSQHPTPHVMVSTDMSWALSLKKKLNRLALVNAFKILRLKRFYKPLRGRPLRVEVGEADRRAYLRRVGELMDLVSARARCVVVGYIGPVDDDCRAMEAFCRERGVPFMAFEAFKSKTGKNLKTDLLPYDGHFNATGNRMLARMFIELGGPCWAQAGGP